MQNTLLVHTIAAFTPAEREEIKHFLADSYFNRGKHPRQIARLFTLLAEKITTSSQVVFTHEELLQALSPAGGHSAGYLDNLMSELLALLRHFIWLQEADCEKHHYLAAARFYRTRGRPGLAAQALRRHAKTPLEARRTLPQSLLGPFEESLEWSQLESAENNRRGDLNLPGTLEALTVFYSHYAFQLIAVLHQQERFVSNLQSGWIEFFEPFRAQLRLRNFWGDSTLALLDLALKLVQNDTSTPLEDVTTLLEGIRSHPHLPEWTLKNLAVFARNFCILHDRNRVPGMDRLLVALYRDHLERGWLYENDRLAPSTLINLVMIGLRTGEHEWVAQILDSQQDRVGNDDNGAVLEFCRATYHFQRGDFAQAGRFVQFQSHKDLEIEKIMRILSIKIAFEQDPASPFLQAQLQAFAAFLRRSKRLIQAPKIELNLHFQTCVGQLARLVSRPPSQRNGLLANALLASLTDPTYAVAERSWLLQKLLCHLSPRPRKIVPQP